LSAHARYAAHAAADCGYGFRSLDVDGYLFEVTDGARRAVFAAGAGTPYALNDARAASIARDKVFCAETLSGAGLPVLPGRMFFITAGYHRYFSHRSYRLGRGAQLVMAIGGTTEPTATPTSSAGSTRCQSRSWRSHIPTSSAVRSA